ncbi:UNKNOWN [Stylonychia lemnae]|uniref:Uncharacterized protein n=1 Tax=Stylonychia lemnae TaxID=5949 RepID=A0A078A4E1_STYLE|nr:UNKNOWN [Stylonychia lemnae]|eukprot:CDW76764.1 UNKNOWN [Stylonychia lemnae]
MPPTVQDLIWNDLIADPFTVEKDGQNYNFNAFANTQTFNLSLANEGNSVTFEIQIRIQLGSSSYKNCTHVFSVTIDDTLCLNADLTPSTFNEQVSQYTIGDSAIILTFNQWNDELFKCGAYEYTMDYSNTFISDNFVKADLTESINEFQLQQSTLNQTPDIICPQNIEYLVRAIFSPFLPSYINLIRNSDSTYKIQVQSNNTSSMGEYDFKYTAKYMNQTVSYILTLQIKEKITCDGIYAPQIEDYTYKIGSGQKIFKHEAFHTLPIPNVCTNLTIIGFVNESLTFPQFIHYNPQFQQISVISQDIKDEGEYLITIRGYASDYNLNSTFILIMLNPCKNAIIKPSKIDDVLYIIGSGEMQVAFASWKSTKIFCNHFTYEALIEEKSLPVANIVDFDSNSRTFKIRVEDSKLNGKHYVIKVIGRSYYGLQSIEFLLKLRKNIVQVSQVDILEGKIIDLSKLKNDLSASIRQISMDGQVQLKFSKDMLNFNDTNVLHDNKTLIIRIDQNDNITIINNWKLSLPTNITIMCKALIDIANLNFIPKDTINEYVREFLFETKATNIGLLNANGDDVLNTIVAIIMFLSLLVIPFIILNFLRKHLCKNKTEFISNIR